MTDPKPDDERLSAMIDGRLQGRQRDELLAHLADDEEDYQLFVDSADVLHELQEEDAREGTPSSPGTLPPSMRPRGWPILRGIAIPAILVGFAALGLFTLRGRASMATPVQLAANFEEGLPGDTVPRPFSANVRGSEGLEEDPVAAAQAGALLMDLAVAVQSGDSMETATLALVIRSRFDKRAAAQSPIVQLADSAGRSPAKLLPLVQEATGRLERLGRDQLRLGAWTEAARFAAERQDAGFFRTRDTRAALRKAQRLTRGDREAGQAVSEIRTLLGAGSPPDWNALRNSLSALMTAITR